MFIKEHVISGIQILSGRLIRNENWILFLISFYDLSGLFLSAFGNVGTVII